MVRNVMPTIGRAKTTPATLRVAMRAGLGAPMVHHLQTLFRAGFEPVVAREFYPYRP